METEPVLVKRKKKKMEATAPVVTGYDDTEDDENEEEEDEYYYCSSSSSPQQKHGKLITRKGNGGKMGNNKRRFSDEQVRSLEKIFESETTKLEPRKKVQVARELGLQPRQVAIWFQNKRARWKSKQMEKNYRALKTSFDCLKMRFESMKMEKEALLVQMQELRSLVEENNNLEQGSGGRHRNEMMRFGEGEEEEEKRAKVEKECDEVRVNDPVRDFMADGSVCTAAREQFLELDLAGHNVGRFGEVNSEEDDEGREISRGSLAYGDHQPQDDDQLLSNVTGQQQQQQQHMEIMSSFVPPGRWCSFDSGGGCLYDLQTSSSTVNYCSPWWESLS